MDKELKEIRETSHEQNKNNNRETVFLNILELKTTITEWKNSLEGLNSRFEGVEKRISKLTEMIWNYQV